MRGGGLVMTVSLLRPLPETHVDVAFGALLRAQRMLSGLTQEELAEHSGLSVRAIRNLEIGRTERPQQQTVELLASALGLDVSARTDLLRAAKRRAAAATGLPADVPEMVGRGDVLRLLTRREGAPRDGGGVARVPFATLTEAPRLVLVSGGPGVGKTAFVVHVAHRLAERFPDGQVYLDLDGADASPQAVLGRVLRALAVSE